MFSNILVPLDGSPLAESALPYARALARRTGADVALVRAVSGVPEIAQAEEYLTRIGAVLAGEGLTVVTGVTFGGDPAEWIVDECDLRKADFIVMASHDRVGVDRMVHGSVAERVVHATKAPVVLVKASAPPEVALRISAEQPVLVVPLDGSQLAEAALEPATRLAIGIGARIVLLRIVPLQPPLVVVPTEVQPTFAETDYAAMEADARLYLQKIGSSFGAGEVIVDAATRIGDAGVEIASIAQQYSAAAVVMATHGRTGLLRSMLGSVAGAVVHSGTTPVVLVHPANLRGAEQPVARLAPIAASG